MRVLALLVLPLCGVLSFGIGRSDAPLAKCPRDGDDPNAAATCGKCHKDHYDEWHGRSHANAWVDPIYQAELKTKSKPESCHACHIPSEDLKRLGKKPEVRKAGGVYYTPSYIVEYIVKNTVGTLLEGKTPKEAAKTNSYATFMTGASRQPSVAPILRLDPNGGAGRL